MLRTAVKEGVTHFYFNTYVDRCRPVPTHSGSWAVLSLNPAACRTKAIALEQHAAARGYGFLCFDTRGHGRLARNMHVIENRH